MEFEPIKLITLEDYDREITKMEKNNNNKKLPVNKVNAKYNIKKHF